jgi:hypothetical protein
MRIVVFLACVFALLCCIGNTAANDVDVADNAAIGKMRVKQLKAFLKERNVVCEGCVEKEHFVAKAIESRDVPVVGAADEDTLEEAKSTSEGAEKKKEKSGKKSSKTKKSKPKAKPKAKPKKKASKATKGDKDGNGAKGGTFATVWSRQAEKRCQKKTADLSKAHQAVCGKLRSAVHAEFSKNGMINM